jgi:Pyruvate/2-oxoacid:ferredoxin oxidoreductase gamma subunit
MLVIALLGDGGCGIGTAHLVHAARRGADVKVLVCNNFNFGMTGGQHSPTTPHDGRTVTTPSGAFEHPFDICQTVAVNGASYAARYSALDAECAGHIETALRHPGFSLLELWELCVAYYVPWNKLTRPGLRELSERAGQPFGVQCDRPRRGPHIPVGAAAEPVGMPQGGPPIRLSCPRRREICLAGSAGQRIRSAAGVIGELCVAGGLFVAQQDDFPITVRKGHSIANLIVSPEPILYAGLDEPDVVILLSGEGAARVGDLSAVPECCTILADEGLAIPAGRANVEFVAVRSIEKQVGKMSAALAVLTCGVLRVGGLDALELSRAADAIMAGPYREENLRAVRYGVDWYVSSAGPGEAPGPDRLKGAVCRDSRNQS